MKLFIDIVMKRIYLFNTVAWNYRKKIGFPVCKKENFAGIQAHRKRGKSARASPTPISYPESSGVLPAVPKPEDSGYEIGPTPHHTLNEEQSARFTAQPLSALFACVKKRSNWATVPTLLSMIVVDFLYSLLLFLCCCWSESLEI